MLVRACRACEATALLPVSRCLALRWDQASNAVQALKRVPQCFAQGKLQSDHGLYGPAAAAAVSAVTLDLRSKTAVATVSAVSDAAVVAVLAMH